MIPVQLIIAGVLAAAGFGSAWMVQEWRYEKTLSDIHAEQALALAAAESKAHETTIRLQKQVDDAARKHASRVADLRRDAAGSRSALLGLSHAADQALRRAEDSHAACLADASTLTVVLGKCSAELQDMAELTDGWHNEAMTLREAWPQ